MRVEQAEPFCDAWFCKLLWSPKGRENERANGSRAGGGRRREEAGGGGWWRSEREGLIIHLPSPGKSKEPYARPKRRERECVRVCACARE
jgi:hypothetical protein